MIVRGFEMEKGVDFVDCFSPTPGLAIARLMMSIAIANDMELHKVDIEQAFLQADKLDEGVNGRYLNLLHQPPSRGPGGRKQGYRVRGAETITPPLSPQAPGINTPPPPPRHTLLLHVRHQPPVLSTPPTSL